jgi:rod shape-determining protein MreC
VAVARVIDTRRSRFLFGALILAHLVVISHQVDAGGGVSLLERGVFAALSPFQTLVARVITGFERAWISYADLRGVRKDNASLRGEVQNLEFLLQQRESEADDAVRLRELLDLRPILPIETLAAEVTSRDAAPWFRSVTVDKGRDQGVELNAPVLSPTGVVGRVVAVGPSAAKVQLLLDRDCGVAVLLQRTRATAVVTGQVGFADSGTLELGLKYLPTSADVLAGDMVVTSGLDGIYPKGLRVGRVHALGSPSGLFREAATVLPSAQFENLEEVLIARTPKKKPPLNESVK